jgi:hypothetical protein
MDAQFLLINGAGREVKWTNSGSYTNTKSLSDPTRVANHPFNTCYKKFVDKLRLFLTAENFPLRFIVMIGIICWLSQCAKFLQATVVSVLIFY